MATESDMIDAVNTAADKFPLIKERTTLCEKLDFVYGVLQELKTKSPWHWQIAIRAIHGLISKTKRAVRC